MTSAEMPSGCVTFVATVWSNATTSKKLGPAKWCSPRDLEMKPGAMYLQCSQLPVADMISHYLTGINRTDGPAPPATLLPDAVVGGSPGTATASLNDQIYSVPAVIFMNLRYGIGENLLHCPPGDYRAWVTQFNMN